MREWLNDFGLSHPLVIGGPCSAETEEQVMKIAHELKDTDVTVYRAGIWKPRTRPGNFEGVGAIGLKWLQRVKEETGLLTATEVANKDHVKLALEHDIDILWIGARSTVSPFIVQEIADALEGTDKIVLVKNPVNPDVALWLGGVERLYTANIKNLGLIHRGFSAYGKSKYRNNPEWQIAVEVQNRFPDLPLICDPSHITGKRDMIFDTCQMALDLNFDGLMIESHISPDDAWSDARQQISPEAVGRLMKELKFHTNVPIITNEELAKLREELDQLDGQIVDVLRKRMLIVKDIATIKEREGMSIFHMKRWMKLVGEHSNGSEAGLSDAFLKELFSTIHKYSVELQTSLIKKSK